MKYQSDTDFTQHITSAGAFRALGGRSREVHIDAAKVERMVQGQGMPGGAGISYDLGPAPGVPPSQAGEVVGRGVSTAIAGDENERVTT